MEKLRRRLQESATKQSDFVETFTAIDREFDKKHNGQIDLSEFLQQLRPPMSERRQKAISNLFDSIDVNEDDQITIMDLKTKFADQLKPTKRRSSQNIDDALRHFLNKFNTPGQHDGIIDRAEFFGSCSMLSATIKEDIYFEHVLRSLFDFRFINK
ncbi:unnamed protein product [Rotaria socialis]|uniref:EF-hand domain-containing protein n=1 Tax=Rotaria socialis TaxID=392032 RepID=A0A818DN22_9BILA|nr:unnamed protein product [Rotaria socialis]CAF4577941.1 unnamed protein product [Rotaria socialis]